MKSEIANMSEKLDTLMTQGETEDEGQLQIKTGSILCTMQKKWNFEKTEKEMILWSRLPILSYEWAL